MMVGAREWHFTAPGTWIWPGTISQVEVILVGGGGGGGGAGTGATNGIAGGGGGGGVRIETVPVTGPVPVIVGAGGAGGVGQLTPPDFTVITKGAPGGDSSFGSVVVGGGGGGGANAPTQPNPQDGLDAPPIGGGGGGGMGLGPTLGQAGLGGAFGFPGARSRNWFGSPTVTSVGTAGGGGGAAMHGWAPQPNRSTFSQAGEPNLAGRLGVMGYGGGGAGSFRTENSTRGQNPSGFESQDGGGAAGGPPAPFFNQGQADAGKTNRGGGGAGGHSFETAAPTPSPIPAQSVTSGGDGGSGRVIVRW